MTEGLIEPRRPELDHLRAYRIRRELRGQHPYITRYARIPVMADRSARDSMLMAGSGYSSLVGHQFGSAEVAVWHVITPRALAIGLFLLLVAVRWRIQGFACCLSDAEVRVGA
jgi:hypothetical protein